MRRMIRRAMALSICFRDDESEYLSLDSRERASEWRDPWSGCKAAIVCMLRHIAKASSLEDLKLSFSPRLRIIVYCLIVYDHFIADS